MPVEEPRQIPGEGPNRRILLVDDDEVLLRAMSRLLISRSYEVVQASNVVLALKFVSVEHFDVIVSDICMPGLTGLHLMKAVRGFDADVPVLFLTGSPSLKTAIAAVDAGALQYLIKPIDMDALCAHLDRASTLHQLAVAKREALALLTPDLGAPGDRATLEVSLERALTTAWMAFQPIVSAQGRAVGYEALLRSREPTLPNPPAVLDAAERLKRLPEVGRRVRGLTAEAFTRAPADALLFVNLHASDLGDEALYGSSEPLAAIASRVVLEITERAGLEEVRDVPLRIAALRRQGFRIAIDDLGAGYSGLTSFALLQPDFVKLDMSLVRDVHLSPIKQRLIGAMTSLCHDLHLGVVAEGIEVPAEREQLLALRCDLLQGYLFGRPVPEFSPHAS
jgi:EAL domain-containing protein (putative c-di-GMP-specific phosphodiesterase class I)/ActR/RegA family two-component response regulator